MNRLALFSLTALTINAFADDEIAASKKASMNKPEVKPQEMSVNGLTSAAPKSSNGWFLFGDVLYWHASEGNTDWAVKTPRVIPAGEIVKAPNHKLDFKWDWGFKIGLGMNTDYDGWDSTFCYTWFQTENSNRIGVDLATEQSTSTHSLVAEDFSSAATELNIHFSMFDWELGRSYFVGKKLSVRPHAGIKGGWIHQKSESEYFYPGDPDVFRNVEEKNNFWGVGVSGGVNTDWKIGRLDRHQFSVFGDFSGALMYGHFDNDIAVTAESAVSLRSGTKITNLDRNLAVPMLQAMFGLMWDTGFNQDRCHFSFKAGYEFQYWFRQNQRLSFFSTSTPVYQRLADDLAFQGLTFDFRFDF